MTLTELRRIRQGNTATPIRAKAFTPDGYVDLTVFASITFRAVGPVTITGAATGDAQGNLSYAWGAGQTNTPGDYAVVFDCVDGSGKTQTFPEGENLQLTIVPAV